MQQFKTIAKAVIFTLIINKSSTIEVEHNVTLGMCVEQNSAVTHSHTLRIPPQLSPSAVMWTHRQGTEH